MEPSTTISNEVHHKTLTPPTTHDHDLLKDRDREHKEPLVISCGIRPSRETNGSSPPREAFLAGKEGSRLEKWVEKEPAKVVVPERWGQEDLLKEWIDYSTFDALLAPKEAGSARQALVAEARPNV